MDSVQEIIVPPPVPIEKGSVTWSGEATYSKAFPFTGPNPGFKNEAFDLGPDVEDIE